jgi:hypothetical protein
LSQGKIQDEEKYILELSEQGEHIKVNFSEMTDDELYRVQAEMIGTLNAWNKVKHPEAG